MQALESTTSYRFATQEQDAGQHGPCLQGRWQVEFACRPLSIPTVRVVTITVVAAEICGFHIRRPVALWHTQERELSEICWIKPTCLGAFVCGLAAMQVQMSQLWQAFKDVHKLVMLGRIGVETDGSEGSALLDAAVEGTRGHRAV